MQIYHPIIYRITIRLFEETLCKTMVPFTWAFRQLLVREHGDEPKLEGKMEIANSLRPPRMSVATITTVCL